MCDRSLGAAVLFDGQCQRTKTGPRCGPWPKCPPEMGFSYPANAGWRLWALAKGGAPTSSSGGPARALGRDGLGQAQQHPPGGLAGRARSGAPMEPLRRRRLSISPIWDWPGIRPLEPGFRRVEIRPQPEDLSQLELVARTGRGPLLFRSLGTAETAS